MNQDSVYHNKVAQEVANSIGHLCNGVMLCGSVAYDPEHIRPETDVDLVGVMPFENTNFQDMYRILGIEADGDAIKLARMVHQGGVNVFQIPISYKRSLFKVSIALWDVSALKTIVDLKGGHLRSLKKESPTNYSAQQEQWGTNGKKRIEDNVQMIDNSQIMVVHPFYVDRKDHGELYFSVQAYNLLLHPKPLSGHTYLQQEIHAFEHNLRERMKEYRNAPGRHGKRGQLLLALPDKIKEKLKSNEGLESYLASF